MRMRASVRYDRTSGDFLLRCEACAVRRDGDAYYWPLSLEFWNPTKGMTMCRACWKEKDRNFARKWREDPKVRARERAWMADYLAAMTPRERRIRHTKNRAA